MFFNVYAFLKGKLFRSAFIRNVTTMLTGNILAQVIALAAAPLITRIYTPDAFGIMVYLTSLVNILSLSATLRYENAIVLPAEDRDANNLFLICLSLITVITICFGLVSLFQKEFITVLLKKAWLKDWIYVVPTGVFIVSVFRTLTFVQARYKSFKLLSLSRIAVSISSASIKIVLGLLIAPSVAWLVIGNLGSPLVAIVILGYSLYKFNRLRIDSDFSFNQLKKVAKRYNKFPRYFFPTSLINSISQNLPVFLLAYYFGEATIGFYGLANTVLRRPISIMSESFSKVFLQKAAEDQNNKKDIRKSFIKGTLGLIMIGIVPFGLLSVEGEWIFSILFGGKWNEAGIYAQILAPWLFFGFINAPANQIIIIREALRFGFFFNLVLILCRIGSIVGGYYLFADIYKVLILFSASGVILNIIYIYYAYRLTLTKC